MILIYDTETTGLPDPAGRGKWEHPSQPWPVSIAAILLDDKIQVIDEYHSMIRIPKDVVINPKAEETHGISMEKLQAEGAPMEDVMRDFQQRFVSKALIHMAYNIQFDDNVVKAWALRLKHNDPEHFFGDSIPTCLLKLATNYLKIPGGHEGYRNVKLFQAYRRITGVPMDAVYKAHDALEDVRACADIYRAMLKSMVV